MKYIDKCNIQNERNNCDERDLWWGTSRESQLLELKDDNLFWSH